MKAWEVCECRPTPTGVSFALSTASEDDPAIIVDEDDAGHRSYRYGMPGAGAVTTHHRRQAGQAIRRYQEATCRT